MNESAATFARLAALTVTWGAFALALVDWGRFSSVERRAGRRAAWVWCAAAVALVLMIGAIRGLAFGWDRFWGFLSGEGWFFLLPALAVSPLIASGQGWARSLGLDGFPQNRKAWRAWPWRTLAAALAVMLAWTLIVANFVPQRGSADLLRRLGLEGMDPWLQLPTAFALLTLAPIFEESLFRHYLLYRVAAGLSGTRDSTPPQADARSWAANAILITSLLWSVGHLGHIEPIWVKWLQVFPPGLILGWTSWKFGLERAIALHWAFNLSLLVVFFAAA